MTVTFSKDDLKEAMSEWLVKHHNDLAKSIAVKIMDGERKDLAVNFDAGNNITVGLDYSL